MSIRNRHPAAARPSRRALLVAAAFCLLAVTPATGANIEAQARALIQTADLRQTVVGLMARDVHTGDVLVAVNPDERMIPASNMKLITTAAALELLGPDYTFQTEWRLIDEDPQAAVLVLKGDGDPALGDPELLLEQDLDATALLDHWVDLTSKTGVRRVQTLIIDDRVFDQQFVHPDWPVDQLNQWYCAEVAGLNFHDNCLDLYPQPTVRGHAPRVGMLPEAPFVEVINRAVTGDADTFWIHRRPDQNVITYRGKVKTARTRPVHVTVHDPPAFCAQLLAHRFAEKRIEVASIRRVELDDELPPGRMLGRVLTPLPTVLARCNRDSQNLFAEALLKRLGHQFTGAAGSWSNGGAAVRKFLSDRLGARAASITVADGSGMSRKNQVSARLLVELLTSMHADQELGPIFVDSLAVGGEDGTLRKRFGAGMTGRVHAKSGYIRSVSCLSGYLVFDSPLDAPPDGPAQRVVAFSILFNGFKAPVYPYQLKQLQNKLVRLLDRTVAEAESTRIGG